MHIHTDNWAWNTNCIQLSFVPWLEQIVYARDFKGEFEQAQPSVRLQAANQPSNHNNELTINELHLNYE